MTVPGVARPEDAVDRTPAGGRLQRMAPTLSAGLVVGVTEAVLATSFAALIFSGPLSRYLPAAVGISMFGAVAILAVVALLSTHRGMLASVQDIPAAVLALAAAGLAARLPPDRPETFFTVVVAIGAASVIAGAAFLVLGVLRLGRLVRFIPLPVVGGLLAGTGVLLVRGGIEVVLDAEMSLASVAALGEGRAMAQLLPAIGLALLLLAVTRRRSSPFTIPGVLLGAVACFYAVFFAVGADVGQAQQAGWLLGPFPAGALWQPWALQGIGTADWSAVAGEAGSFSVLVVFAALALLLNASGIELMTNRDIDLDRELRAAGAANVLSGLGGGLPGYHAVSLTALAANMRAQSRLVGVVAAGVCATILVVGGGLLSLFPRPVLGALLLFVGFGFLVEWLYDSRAKLATTEYLVIVLIVVAMSTVGFFPGVAVGFAAAVAVFIVNYSRLDVVKHALSCDNYRSKRDRIEAEREALRTAGRQLEILELQGYLFFGTANGLLERVRARVADPALPALRYLVLDFRRVSDLDASAVVGFTKITQLGEAEGFTVVYTGVAGSVRRRLEQGPLKGADPDLVHDDLDQGVEWCEDRLLEDVDVPPVDGAELLWGRLREEVGEPLPGPLVTSLERIELPAGHELIRQGEPSRDVYFLESGQLTVRRLSDNGREGGARLRTMGPGAVVGEVALYLGVGRTASVVSDRPSVVYRLAPETFRGLENDDPRAAAALHRLFAKLLAERLADTLQTNAALRD